MRNPRVLRLVQMALLCAVSLILMYLVRFPLLPAAAYLEYDMADVPILIGTFMLGSGAGLCITAVVSLLQWLLVSAQSGPVGALMHFCATGGFVLAAGFIYRRSRTKKGALVSLIVGSLVMILIMIPLNLTLTVYYNGMPYEAVKAMILPVIVPFNTIKALINSVVTFLLYKTASRWLKLGSDKVGGVE